MLIPRLQTRRASREGAAPPVVGFARSGATGYDSVGNNYAANVPRFDPPYRGLLMEGAGTNNGLWSEQLDNAWWAKTRLTVTADAATAPNGNATADKLVEDASAGATHMLSTTGGVVTAATAYALTFYAKAAERSWVLAITAGNEFVYFNLATGAIGNISGATGYTVDVGGGWYRCIMLVANPSSSGGLTFRLATANGITTYTGDGASGLYIWGVDHKNAAYATSYVQTTGAVATRNADNCNLPAPGVVGIGQGAMIVRFNVPHLAGLLQAAGGLPVVLADCGVGAGANRLLLYILSSGTNQTVRFYMWGPTTATTASAALGSALPVGVHTLAGRWNGSVNSVWLDGASKATGNVVEAMTVQPSLLRLGCDVSTGSQPGLPIMEVLALPYAPTDAEMATITAGGQLPHLPGATLYLPANRGNLQAYGAGLKAGDRLNRYGTSTYR